MIKKTIIKSGEYYDSVTLMEVAQGLLDLEGIEDAAVVMGTPANKGILNDAAAREHAHPHGLDIQKQMPVILEEPGHVGKGVAGQMSQQVDQGHRGNSEDQGEYELIVVK
mgnify:CR=1 FL=1